MPTTPQQILDQAWKRGTDFLGTKHSIMCGAMSWVSEHNLVAAISNAGGFGIIACGAMSPQQLSQEIVKTFAKTSKPFGVNIITMHPQIDELVEVCISHKVSHVVLAAGLPKAPHIQALKDNGIKIMCFVPALSLARKFIRMGVDALIIEGMEAGGHIGPVATSVLAQEILPHIKEVPVFVAGGIGSGEMIASYLSMGAAGCQLGTKFVCAKESIAHPNFKQAFIKANARDAVASVQLDPMFHVIPVRAIANKATDGFIQAQRDAIEQYKSGQLSKEEAQLKIEHFWAGALRRAVIDGDVENGSLMAGQSVGMVTQEQSAQEIINELVASASQALHRMSLQAYEQ
jgi:enoyl-[acyl-carrier protein] reductase II